MVLARHQKKNGAKAELYPHPTLATRHAPFRDSEQPNDPQQPSASPYQTL